MSELERLYKLRKSVVEKIKNNLDDEEKRGCKGGVNHFHGLKVLDNEISKLESLRMVRP